MWGVEVDGEGEYVGGGRGRVSGYRGVLLFGVGIVGRRGILNRFGMKDGVEGKGVRMKD